MTAIAKKRIQSRIARHERVRKSVVGTAECPRLAVRRSLSHMVAQIFDDENNKSLVQITTASKEFQGKFGESTKTEQAKQLGLQIAELQSSRIWSDSLSPSITASSSFRFMSPKTWLAISSANSP